MLGTQKANISDFAAAIIEAQEDVTMDKLYLSDGTNMEKKLLAEEMRLIKAIVNSGMTELTCLCLGSKVSWFAHSETQSFLLEFIEQFGAS